MTFALQRDCVSVVPFCSETVYVHRPAVLVIKGNFHGINKYLLKTFVYKTEPMEEFHIIIVDKTEIL